MRFITAIAVFLSCIVAVGQPAPPSPATNALVSTNLSRKATLAWDASPDAASYRLYYGPSPGVYTNSIAIGNVTSVTLSNMYSGEVYYFSVSARNRTQQESEVSNEVRFPIEITSTNVVVTVSVITETSTNILGPWAFQTNIVFVTTNPIGSRFFRLKIKETKQ